MIISQIKNAGIATNKWDTLQNVCNSFLFTNEGYIHVSPKTIQFYFEESSELVFIRYTKPTLSTSKYTSGEYVELQILSAGQLKTYYARPSEGGAVDKTVGRYHAVFDVNEITAIV